VPDRGHTDSSQVLGCEPWQNLGVDLILAEDRLVTLQAQLPQPSRDVQGVPLVDGGRPCKSYQSDGFEATKPFAPTITPELSRQL
jgi:hypothetical protein